MTGEPTPRLRVAIAGLGIAGASHLFDAISHPGLDVVGICARRVERARQIAAPFGVTAVHEGLGALLRMRHPDAVIVATPPGHLTDHACQALRAGCRVLLEKPGAATSADITLLARALHIHGPRRCLVAYPRRYRSGWDHVRAMLGAHRLGEMRRVRLVWRGPYRARFARDADSYRASRQLRVSGVVLDTGSHMVDLCHFLVGPTIEVAAGELVLTHDGVDIAASWRARLAGGCRVEASIADSEDSEHSEVLLEGTRGAMSICEAADRMEIAIAGERFDHAGYAARPVDDLIALGNGGPVRGASLEDALQTAAVIQAIYRAAGMEFDRASRWIPPRAKSWGRLSGAC